MQDIILGISGRIASGKTTLARSISIILKWPYVSFGEYILDLAREKGLSEKRETLQQIGSSFVETNCELFCQNLLNRIEWKHKQSLIIEGIRHSKVLKVLRSICYPSRVFLVYIDVPERTIQSRLKMKGILYEKELERFEKHNTEIEVITILPKLADLRVDGNKSISDLTKEIVDWIKKQNSKHYTSI